MATDLQVVKSNHIISASYRLSVAEQRVILSCIAQIRRNEQVSDDVFYSVTAADLAAMCGTDQRTAYRDLAAAAERLFERRITIMFEPDGSTRHPRKRLTRWVQDVDYVPGEGRVLLRFGKTILPFLTGLTEQFTRYQLSDVARMTSAHAVRLFELLAQYGSVGQREISLEELRDWFQLGADTYPALKDLKRRVIEPAVAQVNDCSPILVTWSQRKTGRKVTHLKFDFVSKSKARKPAAPPAEATQQPAKKPRTPKAETTGPQTVTGYLAFVLSQLKMTEAEFNAAAKPGEDYKQAFARLKRERHS